MVQLHVQPQAQWMVTLLLQFGGGLVSGSGEEKVMKEFITRSFFCEDFETVPFHVTDPFLPVFLGISFSYLFFFFSFDP